MNSRIEIANLKVDATLFEFINTEVLPPLKFNNLEFWSGFSNLIYKLTPKNKDLLVERDRIQGLLDVWHENNKANGNFFEYKAFLEEIGYLKAVGPDFTISSENVDDEVSKKAGPQLVVPIMNARFAINAVNARWGSLYDALYGNDVIPESPGLEKGPGYNAKRGECVINYGRDFLDKSVPIDGISHQKVFQYQISLSEGLLCIDKNNKSYMLKQPEKLLGYLGDKENPTSILLENNDLKIEIKVDFNSNVGSTDLAGVKDIMLESAISTILDCEDSVSAVDAEDKLLSYKNWFGLITGSLTSEIIRNDSSFTRKLKSDREFRTLDGSVLVVPSRSLMFIRNVGHLMTNESILLSDGSEIHEGILDAVITSLISLHDLKVSQRNSKTGSIYIVKPKMHGPQEVKFTDELFSECERLLGLKLGTIKVGLMDEEKRTSVNLYECVRAVQNRIVFINTGFLDRTGDEIHTNMSKGPVPPKDQFKEMLWLHAYEKNNVNVGLKTGFHNKAQIGKGMWAKPDLMADMMREKINHPESGASCAWVPSPTAASLHALHYHEVSVYDQQKKLMKKDEDYIDDMLMLPLFDPKTLTKIEIQREVDNNIQGILGYVVKWIDQGIGCSKVPDINNIGLMEDRATLRISSQILTNWIAHGVCSEKLIQESMERMARIVDEQNAGDPKYRLLSDDSLTNSAFRAAASLIFDGVAQPNGYTEPLLHSFRQEVKAKEASE